MLKYLFLNLCLVLTFSEINAQKKTEIIKGPRIIEYFPDSLIRKASSSYLKTLQLEFKNKNSGVKTLSKTTQYANPFKLHFQTAPSSEVLAVFNKATEIWSEFIFSSVPINVYIEWTNLGNGILGSAGPSNILRNFDGAPQNDYYYPIAIAEKMIGFNQNGNEADIDASFNSNFSNWYIGTDGIPTNRQIDLLSVVIHEIGHGLGYTGNISANTTNQTASHNNLCIYDKFIIDEFNNSATNTTIYPNPSNKLYHLITSDSLYQSNVGILSENNNVRAKLYAPSSFSPGSSIYHVNQESYPAGNPNALMTHSIAYGEISRNLGPIVKGLYKEMGWTNAGIIGDVISNQEPNQNGYLIKGKSYYSSYFNDAVSNVKLWVAENSTSFLQRSLTKSGDDYVYTLPYSGQSSTVNYFWTATDSKGNSLRFPVRANTYLSFSIQIDTSSPVINFTQNNPYIFASQLFFKLPPVISTDNLVINKVEVIYKINNSATQMATLTKSVTYENTFIGSIPLSGMAKGDSLFYKIKATDKSIAGNTSYSPNNSWIKVPIIGPKKALNAFGQTFENVVNTDFYLNRFSVETPNSFTNKSLNTLHPYQDGQDYAYDGELGSDTYSYSDAILLRPVILQANEGQLSFDEIALVEPSEATTSFYRIDGSVNRSFYDYVIVQGSKDGGKTWVDLSAGWDANLHTEWRSAWAASNDIDGNSTTAAIPAWIKKHELNLFQNTGFQVGDEVILRFRMLADLGANGWGWMIDNLKIQGGTQSIVNLEVPNSLPTILTDKIYISNTSPVETNLLFEAKDPDNDNLRYEIISGNNGTLGFTNKGELQLIGNPNTNSDLGTVVFKVSDGTGSVNKNISIVYCETNTNLSGVATHLSKKYASTSQMISTQQINGSSKMQYNAIQSILLNPGFVVNTGSVFEATSGTGCP